MIFSKLKTIACGVAIFILMSGCGFKLKQPQDLPTALQSIHLVHKKQDPVFINNLEKSLTQRGMHLSPLAATKLHIISYKNERRAASINTVNARQTETQVSSSLYFSLSRTVNKVNSLLIPPTTITRSKEYTNDNTNISGKAEEEKNLQREIDKEIIALLLRRLDGVKPQKLETNTMPSDPSSKTSHFSSEQEEPIGTPQTPAAQ